MNLRSSRARRLLAALFASVGAGVAAWGSWLAFAVPGGAAAGEGFDPGFIRGTGVFMVAAGVLIALLAAVAWRRSARD